MGGWGSKQRCRKICSLTSIFNVEFSPTQLPVLFEVSVVTVITPISQADCLSHIVYEGERVFLANIRTVTHCQFSDLSL